jgi:hypothetical protein
MTRRNNLKDLLQELGIKAMVPSEKLLTDELGGMTLIRFNKILSNTSKREMTALEAELFTTWLARMTNKPVTSISLWEQDKKKEGASC